MKNHFVLNEYKYKRSATLVGLFSSFYKNIKRSVILQYLIPKKNMILKRDLQFFLEKLQICEIMHPFSEYNFTYKTTFHM